MERSKLHYRPAGGYFGDTIPFFWEGHYHVFYLKGDLDPWRRVRYTPYCHRVSTDLVNWEELPVALPLGNPEDIDMSLGTGTIIAREGLFYLLYCGRVFKGDKDSVADHWEKTAIETTCLATSPDLVQWTKDPRNPILAPDNSPYEPSDFRDPFPFWNEQEGRYWMVIASLVRGAPANPGGLALAVSADLRTWELREPFWAPNISSMPPECPDIFQAGGRWYLICSYDGRMVYRFADSLGGPWLQGVLDPRDHSNNYAPKTLFDGEKRLLFGWMSTKAGERDDGVLEWGGDALIPRQLLAQPDGTLAEVCPEEIINACGAPVSLILEPRLGDWEVKGASIIGSRVDGLAYAALPGAPDHLLLQTSLVFERLGGSAGIYLRARADLKTYYALRLAPGLGRVVVERWPSYGEVSFLAERPLQVQPGRPVKVQLFIDGDILEAFVNDQFALSCRLYDYAAGELALYSEYGRVRFEDLSLRLLPE